MTGPAAPDDVALTDLEVVQRYSLAVRTGSAPREELIGVLEADLAWLTGGRRVGGGRAAGTRRRRAPAGDA